MLQGAKVSKEIIRHGESRAVVSALFTDVSDEVYDICDEMGISYDREDSFSLSRTINRNYNKREVPHEQVFSNNNV